MRECLTSIYQNVQGDFKVVVCDDGSTDGTFEMVKKDFPQVFLLQNEINRGVSYSTNRILQELDGEYFLRLDADTQVLPGSVEKLLDFMEIHPRAAVVAAGLVDEKRDYQKNVEVNLQAPLFWLGEYLFWLKKAWLKIKNKLLGQTMVETCQVEAMGSAAILVRCEAIKQVGDLDENLPFFLEDSDWVMRIKKAGWELWFNPEAKFAHRGGQSTGSTDIYIHCRDRSLRSLYYFTSKHFPGWANQVLLTLSILKGSLASLLLAVFLWLPSRFNQRAKIIVDRGLRSFWNVFRWHYAHFIRHTLL